MLTEAKRRIQTSSHVYVLASSEMLHEHHTWFLHPEWGLTATCVLSQEAIAFLHKEKWFFTKCVAALSTENLCRRVSVTTWPAIRMIYWNWIVLFKQITALLDLLFGHNKFDIPMKILVHVLYKKQYFFKSSYNSFT